MKSLFSLSCIKAFLLAFIVFFSSQSQAGLEDEMQNMFGSYVNVTPGQVFETQRRGGFAAGSVFIRNKVSNPKIVAFEPPRFKAGCNGIDMFGGSFSFINKEQLVNALRNIASNAMSYAFELALTSLCPSCAQKMSELQAKIESMNKNLLNSCQQGKALIKETIGPSIESSMTAVHDQIASNLTSWGLTSDDNASNRSGSGGDSADSPASIADAAGKLGEAEINITWEALKKSQVFTWYTSSGDSASDNDLKQALMSIAGTITLTKGLDNAGNVSLVPRDYDSKIKLFDFINATSANPLTYWQCDEPVKCLNLTPASKVFTITMKEKIANTIGTDTTSGILLKIRATTADGASGLFTAEEKAFIAALPQPVYAQLRYLSQDPESAAMYSNYMVDTVTALFAKQMLDDMFRAVTSAIPVVDNAMASKMMANLATQRTQLHQMNVEANESLDSLKKGMELFTILRTAIASRSSESKNNVMRN